MTTKHHPAFFHLLDSEGKLDTAKADKFLADLAWNPAKKDGIDSNKALKVFNTSGQLIQDENSNSQTPPSQSTHYFEGDILQKYEIGEKIANTENGGQGTIYRAKRKSDGLEVVVKVYATSENTSDWDVILREEGRAGREIRFLERANSKGIRGVPTLIEYGATGSFIKTPVSVLGHISGRTLEEEVMSPGYNPTLERCREVFEGIKEPLEYAHEKDGLKATVHRDVNPGNVMINGFPILIDWAAAIQTSGRTQIRTRMSTQYFTAPEILGEEEFDSRADIYGVGKVMEFMLLGNTFYEAEGIPSDEDFERFKVPKKVVSVLRKATETNPEKRFKTINEFYNAFTSAFGKNLPAQAQEQVPAPVSKPKPSSLEAVVEQHEIAKNAKDFGHSYTPERNSSLLFPLISKEFIGSQIGLCSLFNFAKKSGEQVSLGASLGNFAGLVGTDQSNLLGANLISYAGEVGGDQIICAGFNLANIAGEVGGGQITYLGGNLANIAGEVGGGQITYLGGNLANIARKIAGDQGSIWGLSLINIASKSIGERNSGISKQIGLINYAGSGYVDQYGLINIRGSGPWHKRVSFFTGKMREEPKQEPEMREYAEMFVNSTDLLYRILVGAPGLKRRLSGKWSGDGVKLKYEKLPKKPNGERGAYVKIEGTTIGRVKNLYDLIYPFFKGSYIKTSWKRDSNGNPKNPQDDDNLTERIGMATSSMPYEDLHESGR